MSNKEIKRVNWFDSMIIEEADFDTEQSAWITTAADNMDTLAGSGVKKDRATQRVLFDLNDVPASISSLVSSVTFDGEPIYELDAFDNVVYLQPSDTVDGSQLEVEVSGASLTGAPKLKVFLFGMGLNNTFFQEVLEFENNGSKITRNYFTSLVAFMTQDFRGNGNTVIDGTACRNVGGSLRILEVLPLSVTTDHIMVEQAIIPNMDYRNFKPAAPAKTLDILLDEIAESEGLDKDDLNINVASTTTRTLPLNTSGLIIGEKFKATTNNIQKISVLLSVQEDTTATPGQEFDWSGDIVLGIRKLQKTTSCPIDTIPNQMIEFDPEPSSLAEVSFNQSELEDMGVVLSDETQIVDFVFTQSLLSNPNFEPSLVVGDYYIVTLSRSGDISKGTIVLEEAANTNADPGETDDMRMSVFYQNEWTDVPESDIWFKIYTSALRITSGTAIDGGISITSPKSQTDATSGTTSSYINGFYSLIDVSSSVQNYVILQRQDKFSDSVSHPTTGNRVFSRIQDYPDVSVVDESTLTDLINAGNETVILGAIRDANPRTSETITGTTTYPGLAGTNTFTIINPSADIINGNLVGSVLVPNTSIDTNRYRIIGVTIYDDLFGDVNGDGTIDYSDVTRAQELAGYGTDLVSGTIAAATQQADLIAGTINIQELIRADVTDSTDISVLDAQAIQQFISLGTAFTAGSTFKRAVITVEDLTDPLTTTPDILGTDSSFNNVPFTNITYRIEPISLWSEENLMVTDLRRFIPQTFTTLEESNITGITKSGGANSFYVPGDVLVGGNLLDEQGNSYNFDFEVNTITLELSAGYINTDINLFNDYIKDVMSFSDGSLVDSDALTNNQVKVSVSVQSITKDLDGYDVDSIDSNPPIDESISVLYVSSSGLLRIRANNMRLISTRAELSTKLLITVYLKKAGFANDDVSDTVDATVEPAPVYIIVGEEDGSPIYLDASYLDGYASEAIENQRWIDCSDQLQDVRDALDGYVLHATLDGYALKSIENQRWVDTSGQLQGIRDSLDGYALESIENQRWIDTSDQLQNLRDAIDSDGYTKATGATGDGYVCFFTGTNVVAGDNDLYWNRYENQLSVGGQALIGGNDGYVLTITGNDVNPSGIYSSGYGDGYGVLGIGGYAGVCGDGGGTGYGVVAKSTVKAALRLLPQDTAPVDAEMGDIYCNSAGTLHFFDGATWRLINLT